MESIQRPTSVFKEQHKLRLTWWEQDIINTLLYFDIFNYPLTKSELLKNTSLQDNSLEKLEVAMESLLKKNFIQEYESLYSIQIDQRKALRRLEGNVLAKRLIDKAKGVSLFISKFPFVRGVYLSGSLSKGYADKNSDIDYFIVTTPGKLWLARTLLILYKKVFLFNSRKYFCLNYFIDSNHLEIKEKNVFTAKELYSLVPMYNHSLYTTLLNENKWAEKFLPHYKYTSIDNQLLVDGWLKKSLERAMGGQLGNALDSFCMSITEKFWKQKFKNNSQKKMENIRCQKHVSKFHPNSFQEKVLARYEEGKIKFEEKFLVRLSYE